MPWVLVVEDGGREFRHSVAEARLVVGSGQDADLRIDHPTVSRRHAELDLRGKVPCVRDLGSSNGTRLEGAAIDGSTLVRVGQGLHFGSVRCHLEHTDSREMEPAVVFEAPLDRLNRRRTPTGPSKADEAEGAALKDPRTLSIGSVREFVETGLPKVVRSLEARLRSSADPLDLVQTSGLALYESFPCQRLEIWDLGHDTDEPGLLFRAGTPARQVSGEQDEQDNDVDENAQWVRVTAGTLEARICLTPGLHVDGIVPLVTLVTRLAALGQVSAAEAELAHSVQPTAARQETETPPLPSPATLDPVVRRIYEEARRMARGSIGVLITGESGTGKEVLARFIHACSPRSSEAWVALNCAALPQDLLEAELFGIERGVATGVEARAGTFERAHGGTLFLDEVADMAPATQAKILRVLQEGVTYRLGGQAQRPAQVRVIAASNRDLGRMVEDGSFRLDLYHRIADCRLHLPPLRERLADLPNLATHFLQRAAAEQQVRPRGLSRAALEALLTWHWPGNVRQLEREMARAALFLEDGELLQSRHLSSELARLQPASGESLRARLESHERGIITETLLRHEGNVRAAAEELKVGRATLYRRIQELGIDL